MNLDDTRKLCESLMIEHELGRVWRFKWMHAYNTFGRCNRSLKLIELSKHFVLANNESEVRNTILHEIAHAKCHKRGHNKYWRAWCIKLGARPIRLNTIAIAPEKK